MTPQDLPSLISENLNTRFVGQRLIYHPSLPSTMDEAQREARQGALEGTVIIAGEQTKGRGRTQRSWLTPPDNIALSIVLYPDTGALPYLIMMASLAVVGSIENVTGLKAQIKWPNDILIDGKKVCGILIENEFKGNEATFSIVGIGINVALKYQEIPEISNRATSLEDEVGREISKADVIISLLEEFERLYLLIPESDTIFNAWRDGLVTLGKEVIVEWGEDTLEGVAESVDTTGAIMLRASNGSLTRIVAGDVTLRHNE